MNFAVCTFVRAQFLFMDSHKEGGVQDEFPRPVEAINTSPACCPVYQNQASHSYP